MRMGERSLPDATKVRLGLIARMDNTGLGNQTWEYYKQLKPAKTLVVDLSKINKSNGKTTKNFPERYPENARFCEGFPTREDFEWLLDGIDVLFSAEMFYGWWVVERARELGVKTALHYNYEFLDYLNQDRLPNVDLLIAPSSWHSAEVAALAEKRGMDWVYLPLGVDRSLLPFQLRKEAKTFIHVAGQTAFEDRNGTLNFLLALQEVKSKINVIIYSQATLPVINPAPNVNLVVRHEDVENYWELFDEGDVMVLPRKYGGQSLPMHEALSRGMVVLMPNCKPQCDFLPVHSLLPCYKAKTIMTRAEIEVYETEPQHIARKIDELVMFPQLVPMLSKESDKLAASIDWARLAPEYQTTFEQLCKQ